MVTLNHDLLSEADRRLYVQVAQPIFNSKSWQKYVEGDLTPGTFRTRTAGYISKEYERNYGGFITTRNRHLVGLILWVMTGRAPAEFARSPPGPSTADCIQALLDQYPDVFELAVSELISPERRQFIHDQVFLTVINDGDWYHRTEDTSFDKFTYACSDARCANCVALGGQEKLFCDLALWESRTGRVPTLADVDKTCHQKVLPFYLSVRHEFFGMDVSTNLQSEKEPEVMNHTDSHVSPSAAPAFQTLHLVFGVNVEYMSPAQLVDAIKRVESEIADLKAVKTKSAYIAGQVKELETMLAKIVETLDAKDGK